VDSAHMRLDDQGNWYAFVFKTVIKEKWQQSDTSQQRIESIHFTSPSFSSVPNTAPSKTRSRRSSRLARHCCLSTISRSSHWSQTWRLVWAGPSAKRPLLWPTLLLLESFGCLVLLLKMPGPSLPTSRCGPPWSSTPPLRATLCRQPTDSSKKNPSD
jgi:hypothetical protein